jgi:hypothetical protein
MPAGSSINSSCPKTPISHDSPSIPLPLQLNA